MSSPCSYTGHPETYGLGIRLSFYVLWYNFPLSAWVARSETKLLRLIHSFLVAGTFLGIVIQTNRDLLKRVEIYIGILLVFATYLYYVPLYIWRFLTCCQIPFDPLRYPLVQSGPVYSLLHFFLLLAIAFFKLWFWFNVAAHAAPRRVVWSSASCQEYGFFFSQVRLEQNGFVVGNILIVFLIVVGCLVVAVLTGMKVGGRGWVREVVDDDGRSISVTSSEFDEIIDVGKVREAFLQELDTFIYLLTVSTVVAAIELTIQWNDIRGVNSLASPAQTIPFVIAIGALARVLYIALIGDLDERYRIRRGESIAWGRYGNWGVWLGFRRRDGSSVYSSRT